MPRLLLQVGVGLAVVGLLVVSLGLLWTVLGIRGLLPGDIVISRPGFTVVIPIATSLLLSVVLSLVMWAIFARRR